jgi:hypothetical protein
MNRKLGEERPWRGTGSMILTLTLLLVGPARAQNLDSELAVASARTNIPIYGFFDQQGAEQEGYGLYTLRYGAACVSGAAHV